MKLEDEDWARLFRVRKMNGAGPAHLSPGSTGAKLHQPVLLLIQSALDDYPLTPAEASVATLVVLGETNEAIAALRGAMLGTVKAQVRQILQKARAPRRDAFIGDAVKRMAWLAVYGTGGERP